MPQPPSLNDIKNERCNYEWLETNISGFFLGDFVDSENEKSSISNPDFYLFSNASESEYGSIFFENAIITVKQAEEDKLQNLEGENPLGSINYYDKENSGITIFVASIIYNNLINLLTHNINNINLKVAIPIWKDENIKFLPLFKYQLTYKYKK